jgi:hypothetical protein
MTFFALAPVLEEPISSVTATPSRNVGDRVIWAGEEYVYCFNAGGGQCNPGNGVKFVTGASGYSVAATSVTDTFNPCVGVVKHVTLTTDTYGWVMTKGFRNVVMVSATTADYKMIALGVDGKFIEASGTTTMGTAVAVGYVLNANTGAGGTAYAFIRTAV